MGGSPEQQRLVSTTSSTAAISNNDPSSTLTLILVSLYVLSGCTQPILMTAIKSAGLADPSCQLYMLFYYLGTASAVFLLKGTSLPSKTTIAKASGIAIWDIGAQSMNYTGAALAGPTIFAIVYSSVTIWAALYSQAFLARRMNRAQWMAVLSVFGGLALTATDSLELGPGVVHGLVLVVLGSSMHGLFYVMSEAVMTKGSEVLTVEQNCAVQGVTASLSFALWQLLYTLPRWQTKLGEPTKAAGTTALGGLALLVLFGFVSFVHSITFYHTLRHLPGGSTSAGVFKGLQAVLVFVLTHLIYCGRVGGDEMCFSTIKFLSLVTVAGGVLWYGHATSQLNATSANNKTIKEDNTYQSVVDPSLRLEMEEAPMIETE